MSISLDDIFVPVAFGDEAINLARCIGGITPSFLNDIPEDEIEAFRQRCERFADLIEDADLHRCDAQAHFQYAVTKIIHDPVHYGLAKWESQMVAEKTLKTFIRSHGQEPPTKGPDAHSLSKLAELAGKNGLKADLFHLVPLIECKAGVRYREIPVSLEEAVKAHQASIELAALVSREMPGEEFSWRLLGS